MGWDEPTREELDDAIVEDTVHCARCQTPHILPEGHISGDRSICEECTDDEIAGLIRERDEARAERDDLGGLLESLGVPATALREGRSGIALNLERSAPERCEHGISAGEYCAPCREEYRRARRAAGIDIDPAP